MKNLDLIKIKTPIKRSDIRKIEKQFGITINIYSHNDGEINVIEPMIK